MIVRVARTPVILRLAIGTLTTFLCSCGVSGGKRLASTEALRTIEYFQKAIRENPYWTKPNSLEPTEERMAKEAIGVAKHAGDTSREADVRISMDLDVCVSSLGLFDLYRISAGGPEEAELKKTAEDTLTRCIDELRAHLGINNDVTAPH